MPGHLVETILTPEEKKYRKCLGFGCCQLRTCVFVVGILELLALGAAVVTLFVLYELTVESFTNRHQISNNQNLINFHDLNGTISKYRLDSSESSEEKEDMDGLNLKSNGGKSSDSSEEDDDQNSERRMDMNFLRAKHRYYVRSMVGAAAAFVVGVFVVALMFTGLAKRRSRFLLPHLVVQILAMIGLLVVIILYSVWCASVDESSEAKKHLYPINQSISCWLIIGSCIIALILEIISFWSVFIYYRYLKNSTQIEHHSIQNPLLGTYNGKGELVKWAHRCQTAPGGTLFREKI